MENLVVYQQNLQFIEPIRKIFILTEYTNDNKMFYEKFLEQCQKIKCFYFGKDNLTMKNLKGNIYYHDSDEIIDLVKAKSKLVKAYFENDESPIALICDSGNYCKSICVLLSFIQIFCDNCFKQTCYQVEKQLKNSEQAKFCFKKIQQLQDDDENSSNSQLFCCLCRDIQQSEQSSSSSNTLLKNGLKLSQYTLQQEIPQQISHEFVFTRQNLLEYFQQQQNQENNTQQIPPNEFPSDKKFFLQSSLFVNNTKIYGFDSEDFKVESDACPKIIHNFQAKKQKRDELIMQ